MNIVIVIAGVLALVAIATAIGRTADRRARSTAWRMIADERRRNWNARHDPSALPCLRDGCPFRQHPDVRPADDDR